MRTKTSKIITGSVVSLAAVAVMTGAGGGAVSAANHSDSSMPMHMTGGHGADSDMNHWEMYDKHSDMARQKFDMQVKNSLNMAYDKMDGQHSEPLYKFNDHYKQAWTTYDTAMQKAHDMYQDHEGMHGDQARNEYMDAHNKATSQFMNDLDSAKNMLSSQMDQAGMAQHKDMFMNQFNSAKDNYAHMMDKYKSDLYGSL